MYTECELETILKEHYRKEREQNGVKDTNVTNTLKSLKGEVLSRLEPRESKGIKLNTHSVGQQWPQLRALLAHLVERIEELETAATHKDKRIEVLTRKIQLIENNRRRSKGLGILRAKSPVLKNPSSSTLRWRNTVVIRKGKNVMQIRRQGGGDKQVENALTICQ